MSHKTRRIECDSCYCFASGYWHTLDTRNLMINKLRAIQCCRYVQPSNKDEFEFFGSATTSINKRTRSRARQYMPSIYELATNIYEIVRVIIRVIVIELSASDYKVSSRMYWTSVFRRYLYLYLFNLFEIYLTGCNSNLSLLLFYNTDP